VAARPAAVLVVENERAVREMLGLVLHHHGIFAYLAGSGEEALRIYCRHPNAIDVVLLDVQMPHLDGPQTLAALRKIDPAVRVVFMSGNTGRYSGEELLALGAARVLQKPFDSIAELGQLLRGLAGRG